MLYVCPIHNYGIDMNSMGGEFGLAGDSTVDRSSGKVSLLLIDDSPYSDALLTELDDAIWDVKHIEDCSEVEDLLELEPFNCIVADPECLALGPAVFLETVQSKSSDIPCVFWASSVNETQLRELAGSSMYSYIPKESGEVDCDLVVNQVRESIYDRHEDDLESLSNDLPSGLTSVDSVEQAESVLDVVPEPMVAFDSQSFEVLTANRVAFHLFDFDGDDFVGDGYYLPLEEDRQRYSNLFDVIREQGSGKYTSYLDGTPIYLKTSGGNSIPVEMTAKQISHAEDNVMYVHMRVVSQQKRYEVSLRKVNDITADLLNFELTGFDDVAEFVVDRIIEDLDYTNGSIFLYDEVESKLEPSYVSGDVTDVVDSVPDFTPGNSVAWEAFSSGEIQIYDDIRNSDHVYNSETPIRSELVVPVGKYGVLLISDTVASAFDDVDVKMAEILSSTIQAAFENTELEAKKKEREKQLKYERQQLRHAEELNDRIRSLNEVLVGAHSKDTIKAQVCQGLAQLDGFDSAFFGSLNEGHNEMQIDVDHNVSDGYFDLVDLSVDEDNLYPPIAAYRNNEIVSVDYMGQGIFDQDWKKEAINQGFKSMISIPITHHEYVYGVLTVFSTETDNFGDTTSNILRELASLIGYSFNTIEQRIALTSDSQAEYGFEITGQEDTFTKLSSDLDAKINIQNFVLKSNPSNDNTALYLAHCNVNGVDQSDVINAADDLDRIGSIRLIDDEPNLYEVVFESGSIATEIAELGVRVGYVEVDYQKTVAHLTVPLDESKKELVNKIQRKLGDVSIKTVEHPVSEHPVPWKSVLDDSLTDRQKDILQTAYKLGYFESPRPVSSTDLADSFDIAQPTMSRLLRMAEANLFEAIWD